MQKGKLDITHTLMANAGELEEARLERDWPPWSWGSQLPPGLRT